MWKIVRAYLTITALGGVVYTPYHAFKEDPKVREIGILYAGALLPITMALGSIVGPFVPPAFILRSLTSKK